MHTFSKHTSRRALATTALLLTTALAGTACGTGPGPGDDTGARSGGRASAAERHRAEKQHTRPKQRNRQEISNLAALRCHIHAQAQKVYAGHYKGTKAVPPSSSFSAVGAEAQCLLRYGHFSPGTVDGVFGPNSERAMKRFQQTINKRQGYRMKPDGLPGPQSWPYLRQINSYDGRI